MSNSKPEGLTKEEVETLTAEIEQNACRISELITELRERIKKTRPSRERSLAETKLDECELWLTRCYQVLESPS
jgi:hypothetical protein